MFKQVLLERLIIKARIYTALIFTTGYITLCLIIPIPVTALSKAWVWGRSLVGIAGSNPARGKDVCCECWVLPRRGICD